MDHYAQAGDFNYRPEQKQEYGISYKAREIGAAEAKTLLMKLELVMHQPEIKQLIQQYYMNHAKSQESEQPGAAQAATKPTDKAPVKDQPSISTPKDAPR